MRDGSRAEHEDAENSDFTTELLAGRISKAGYTPYLLRLRELYAVMETEIRSRLDDPMVAAVHDPALERLAAIDADLDHWAPGAPHELDLANSPAIAAYCRRLHEAEWGGALVAHHYTRYLGDLSGGQAIGRTLDRAFELAGAGVSFYAFPEIPKPKPYKDAYRARLDALPLSPADIDRIVQEVKVAFGLNQALFTELGARIAEFRRRP